MGISPMRRMNQSFQMYITDHILLSNLGVGTKTYKIRKILQHRGCKTISPLRPILQLNLQLSLKHSPNLPTLVIMVVHLSPFPLEIAKEIATEIVNVRMVLCAFNEVVSRPCLDVLQREPSTPTTATIQMRLRPRHHPRFLHQWLRDWPCLFPTKWRVRAWVCWKPRPHHEILCQPQSSGTDGIPIHIGFVDDHSGSGQQGVGCENPIPRYERVDDP